MTDPAGQHTSGIPDALGDIGPFQLPNSRLVVLFRMKMFVRGSVDESDIGPVLPHIEVAHRNVTIELKTRWLTPAGLCISTQ